MCVLLKVYQCSISKSYTYRLIDGMEFNKKLENDIRSILDNEYKTKDDRFNALMDLINDYVDSFCR